MWRGCSGTRVSDPSGCFSKVAQPLLTVSHSTKAPTMSGSDDSIAFADALSGPRRAYGLGTGSATIAGCESSAARDGDSGTYSACRVASSPVIS